MALRSAAAYLLRNLRRAKEKPDVKTTGKPTVTTGLPRFFTPDSASVRLSSSCTHAKHTHMHAFASVPLLLVRTLSVAGRGKPGT